jgi:hypothetical protein
LEQQLEVSNYEHNLTLHYEAKRKELDILLTSSIPIQLSNMKTILWIDFLMIGLILQFIKKFPMHDMIIGFFILSLFSIITILFAMLTNRYKSYGVFNNINTMSKYDDDIWTKSKAIYDMLNMLQLAIEDNREVIQNRAKLMHIATWYTLSGLLFLIVTFTIKNLTL